MLARTILTNSTFSTVAILEMKILTQFIIYVSSLDSYLLLDSTRVFVAYRLFARNMNEENNCASALDSATISAVVFALFRINFNTVYAGP